MRRKGLNRRELERAKNQMKGGLMLGLESTHSRMNKLAKDELYQGRHSSLEEMLSQIDRVSESDVLRIAREMLDLHSLSVTALGRVSRRSLQTVLN